ncbi:MAG: phosphotransferase [Acidobacteriota bacterium]
MRAVIIGDGLAEANLSPDDSSHPAHVGPHEVDRLMGSGVDYPHGPLPAFLRLATQREGTDHLDVLFLDASLDVQPVNLATDTFSARSGLSTALRDARKGARVIPLPTDAIPWKYLEDMVEAATRRDAEEGEGPADVRCLVVGSHTERRILAVALFLRTLLSAPRVAVAAHLVGSATREAHFATLRSTLPASGVEVLLDLEEAADYVGLDRAQLAAFARRRCRIEPEAVRAAIDDTQRRIIELLCMHWTQAELRPLAGGFSGSQLFVAEGSRDGARTEPMVIKIDELNLMRRELEGYYQVKDFFGRNVPNFGHPVRLGGVLGVGMELATMEGSSPTTLQETFEGADSEEHIGHFLRRLDKALSRLSEKLYRNTRSTAWVVPYRAFGLHAEQELRWFRDNCEQIQAYCAEDGVEAPDLDVEFVAAVLQAIVVHEDGVDSEVCLCHGDLNFANILSDSGENLWFIDWTHSGRGPLERDFVKLENDVKLVMSKEFAVEDLPRLRSLEALFLERPLLPHATELPPEYRFVRWDLRFRKILDAVRRIRDVCFSLREDPDGPQPGGPNPSWLVYRVGLLRHALHTLSYDQRRGRGECELPQLLYALYSVQGLVADLSADKFHLQIRGERPPSYPARQRILVAEAAWSVACPHYAPPYYVDPEVLAHDYQATSGGWADPEDVTKVTEDLAENSGELDETGRPRNPAGRTGLAGRGLLGRWGANLSVSAVVTRVGGGLGQAEILLGRRELDSRLDLPKGFVLPGENATSAISRVLERETGWTPDFRYFSILQDGYVYDPRQTDHAWVESRAVLFALPWSGPSIKLVAGGDFNEVRWRPLTAGNVNRLPSDQARFIRLAVSALLEKASMDQDQARLLLEQTG